MVIRHCCLLGLPRRGRRLSAVKPENCINYAPTARDSRWTPAALRTLNGLHQVCRYRFGAGISRPDRYSTPRGTARSGLSQPSSAVKHALRSVACCLPRLSNFKQAGLSELRFAITPAITGRAQLRKARQH